MRLVKKEQRKAEPGRCGAITKGGSRCARTAQRDGYCNQHYKLLREQGVIVDTQGNKPLTRVPDPPEALGKVGREHWHIYCQFLVDQNQLYQVYLLGLANLCYLEEQLEDVKADIEQWGIVNRYDSGVQRNGYASHYDKLLTHIRSLRADYGVTIASMKSSSSSEKSKPQTYSDSKAKRF